IVPTRGIIHDIGRAMTHKKIILKFFKEGYQTPEIARKDIKLQRLQGRPIIRKRHVTGILRHIRRWKS
ncbi:MAG: DUF1670 domain-containing protein, partial [ANME-2 cluster archaeon]|nr:DUF1670 domain-containing protein [ANME-2 cluster archaeon]